MFINVKVYYHIFLVACFFDLFIAVLHSTNGQGCNVQLLLLFNRNSAISYGPLRHYNTVLKSEGKTNKGVLNNTVWILMTNLLCVRTLCKYVALYLKRRLHALGN